MAPPLKLSIVIPVGPGERAWPRLLDDLAALEGPAEILLVAPRAEVPVDFRPEQHGLRVGARWLESGTGRARQQNAGARAARGETLWFLHADSRLPARALDAAWDFAGREALGYLDLHFAGDGPVLARLNALGARLRSRWLRLPFGDQGLMLPRHCFRALGGFDESLSAAEDHAFIWTARRAGLPLVPIGTPLLTSARRYREQGWLRTTIRHGVLTVAQAARFAKARDQAHDRARDKERQA